MNIRPIVFALIFLVLGFTARAQQDSTVRFVRYGVFGSAGANFHNAQFSSASDLVFTMNKPATYMYPFVINHDASATFGWSVGALVELPVWDVFGLSLRASFSQIGNTFTAFDEKKIGMLSADGAMVNFRDVRFSYIADMSSLAHLGVEPYLTCRPFDMVVLYLGAQFATTINRKYRRFTSVADTNGISAIFRVDTVENGRLVWNRQTAEFPGMSALNIGISGGIGIEIPLENTKQWLCAIEVFYTGFLGSLASNLVSYRATENVRLPYLPQPGQIVFDVPVTFKEGFWSLSTLRAGVSLRYAPFATGK